MRIVVVAFAVLMTLGLVAFGVVLAQKGTGPVALMAPAAGVSAAQNTVPAAKSEKAPIRLAEAANGAASPPRRLLPLAHRSARHAARLHAPPENNAICSAERSRRRARATLY